MQQVRAVVEKAEAVDLAYRDGDPFWDGDQTLWRLHVSAGGDRGAVFAVVPRGDAFVPAAKVREFVNAMGLSLKELQALAESPAPGRRPRLILPIEPGD